MTINIIAVGSKPSNEIAKLVNMYTNRLPRNIQINWRYIKHGADNANRSKTYEAEKILKEIKQNSYVLLLDEVGTNLTSKELSNKLFGDLSDITIVIGGAFGVNQALQERANFTLSLSKLVFPHQLVKVILVEQIYRAYTISIGHPYHHS